MSNKLCYMNVTHDLYLKEIMVRFKFSNDFNVEFRIEQDITNLELAEILCDVSRHILKDGRK